ncbi:hypothetical protein ACFP9V_26070 [Deinococcus radiopugnans]|uniref:Uncharacterized protein n=1 Tax=Deinococcus radiopugnans ATCC 19172 TaxID=585398 RepID=A0A5C4XYE7_9DEIO|nr:hypothetical protein [Deinococcus radiopugnans]MBB6018175.1 hypothetical protein [Deinococcus radiopugnans ATCC 19172]TNM68145.1 hypothetical protein FHR04_16930 [Deinococcus radiopugnans ATCC 19172]
MPTLHLLPRRLAVALLTLGLLGAPGALGRLAVPAEEIGNRLTEMSGTGLKFADCEQRLQTLETMLGRAGYVSRRSHLGADAVMTALWYHPQRHTSVVAFSGWQAADNAFSAKELDGEVRWNELLATP